LLDTINRLAAQVRSRGDDADALLLVEHRANDVELRAGVAWLATFVFDLGLLLGMGNASLLSSLGGFDLSLRRRGL
jgi:hypothetical protein